jgi:2-polyprenyl-3-methyl-5-hydroxy-6-metoxy-1,4-benzoquinol methylase
MRIRLIRARLAKSSLQVAMNTMLNRIRRRFSRQSFPHTADALEKSDLFTGWWYYSVELLPGLITKGHYPDSFPMLPRILLRNCDLRGTDCLDLGSMEGLMAVVMCRQGAKAVLATDAIDHCREKMAALRYYYKASFEFQQVGLMYDLNKKLRKLGRSSFDIINLSGLLYHVFSPLLVLAGVRPLLKRNGLLIVSTNVVVDDSFTMQFNNAGRLQEEVNTFWYLSVRALDYLLRYLKLAPVDCLYIPHRDIKSSVRYMTDVDSGYLSVVCRAKDSPIPAREDKWMLKSAQGSWEYTGLIDWNSCSCQPLTQVPYSATIEKNLLRDDTGTVDLLRALLCRTIHEARKSGDAHVLRLADMC